ncbi:hypothetical protein B7463_g2649, partial [Scytalidium lignicola]
MPIPMIVIEGEDKALDSSSGTLSESNPEEDSFQKEITDRSSIESTTQVLRANQIEHFASENTYWYIYEPVIIVPLGCHVGNEQLGILLTKGSVNALKEIRQSQLSPLATIYASVSGAPVADPNSISILRRFDSIDIRISPLLSAGYSAHEDSGRGWSLDSLGGAVVQGRQYPLFVLFHHATGDDKSYPPFFLHIPGFIKCTMLCEIGIFRREKGSDYEVYAFDLAKDRYAEAELGNGRAVTVKLREGNHASFLSTTIGTWSGNSRPSKVTRAIRLSTATFTPSSAPAFKKARISSFLSLNRPRLTETRYTVILAVRYLYNVWATLAYAESIVTRGDAITTAITAISHCEIATHAVTGTADDIARRTEAIHTVTTVGIASATGVAADALALAALGGAAGADARG